MDQRIKPNELRGVNILTSSKAVIVDGAEELLESFNKGEITAEDFREKLLTLDTVYVDRTQSKGV